jgi:hypothetical protein
VVARAHIPVHRLNAERQSMGLLPAPSRGRSRPRSPIAQGRPCGPESFTLWGQRHPGVPGTPPGMAGYNSQDADSHNRVTARHEIVQNEPNFAPPHAADGADCAKRSQT